LAIVNRDDGRPTTTNEHQCSFHSYVPMAPSPGHRPPQHMMMGTAQQPMSVASSNEAMSFMMMDPNLVVNQAGVQHGEHETASSMMMPSMTMTIQSDGTGTMSAIELSHGQGRPGPAGAMASAPSAVSMNSSSAPLMAHRPPPNRWLEQQQYDYAVDEQLAFDDHYQQQQRPGGEGEHYYASPWGTTAAGPAAGDGTGGRLPLVSPAKFLRNGRQKQSPRQQTWSASSTRRPTDTSGRLSEYRPTPAPAAAGQTAKRQQQQQQQHQQTIMMVATSGSQPKGRQQQQQQQQVAAQKYTAPMPIVIIRNHWRPSGGQIQQQQDNGPKHEPAQLREAPPSQTGKDRPYDERHWPAQQQSQPKLSRQQEQQIASALERESLVQVGPARLVPIYQTANGRISMTPPPAVAAPATGAGSAAHAPMAGAESAGGELSAASSDHGAADSNTEVETNDSTPAGGQPTTSMLRDSQRAPDRSSSPQDLSFDQDAAGPATPSLAPAEPASTARRRPVDTKRSVRVAAR
jgi:hypothetical protein